MRYLLNLWYLSSLETALCDIRHPLAIPKELGSVYHEVELAVLIGTELKQANEERVAGQLLAMALRSI